MRLQQDAAQDENKKPQFCNTKAVAQRREVVKAMFREKIRRKIIARPSLRPNHRNLELENFILSAQWKRTGFEVG